MNQDRVFFEREGNAWFKRNKESIIEQVKMDWPLFLIDLLDNLSDIETIVELGCANGWRLNILHGEMLKKARCVGVDASFEAILDGKQRYPGLELYQGLLSNIPLDEQFDLVIVNFVLHWVERHSLFKSISEIDRLTKQGGTLIIGDFLPDFQHCRRYHHCSDKEIYTYKQDYPKLFESTGIYKEVARIAFNHDDPKLKIQPCNSSARGVCSVLRKSLTGYYMEVK